MTPIINEIKNAFTKDNLKYDLPAGLVVFLVALPLCLGISMASGVPLFSGLITGIIGGMIVSMLSGSALSVSGPAAGLTIIVLNALHTLGSYKAFLLAVLIAGILQVVLGYLKAGNIGKFFPASVIKGMLAAIGIILILKQIPHALGYDKDYEGDFAFFQTDKENTLTEILAAMNKFNPGAILIGLISVAILVLWDRPFFKKFRIVPGPLIVVLISVLINKTYMILDSPLLIEEEHLVNIPLTGSIGEFFSHFTLPDFAQLKNKDVYLTAITLTLVASIETLLSVEAIDKLDPEKRTTPNNRELKAQGIGNIISGLIGGLPMTAVIVRGSANIDSGAKSKASSFFHGCFLLLSVIFIPSLINMIPLSALAAILLMTGYKLTKVSLFKEIYQQGSQHFIPFLVTIIAILFTDLLIGISIGMVVGALFILKRSAGNSFFLHKKEFAKGNSYSLILSEEVTFLNKAAIAEVLESFTPHSNVVIDGAKSKFIDDDVLEIINDYKTKALKKNIKVEVLGMSVGLKNLKKNTISSPEYHYQELFTNNRKWVESKLELDPDYFIKLNEGQEPFYLLIGCSDSRVHPNEITGTEPGEMFTHRNIANLVLDSDENLLSVIQYSIEVLKIKHIIVCGHYGCGGIKGAIDGGLSGPIDHWLQNVRDTIDIYKLQLESIEDPLERNDKLVEFNVAEQVNNLYNNAIIRKSLAQGSNLKIHGWVYDMRRGVIKELELDANKILLKEV
jgi:carbonic anhydrase